MTQPATNLDPSQVRVMCAGAMGWTNIHAERFAPFALVGTSPEGGANVDWPIEWYTTSIDAAMALVEKMREEGWLWDTGHAIGGGYRARFFNSNAEQIEGFADHPATATALAFLRAKGRIQ